MEKIKNAVEIIGSGLSLQNYHPRCEHVWVMNTMNFVLKDTLTQGFIMDDMRLLEQYGKEENRMRDYASYINEIKKRKPAVLTSKVQPGFEFMTEYPLKKIIHDICNWFPHLKPEHFMYTTSSLPYLLWYALYKDIHEIHLHGCDFASNKDDWKRVRERFNAEYWVGILIGLGIDIKINPASTLLDTVFRGLEPDKYSMYGYYEPPTLGDLT